MVCKSCTCKCGPPKGRGACWANTPSTTTQVYILAELHEHVNSHTGWGWIGPRYRGIQGAAGKPARARGYYTVDEAYSVAKTSPTGGKIHATCAMPDDARCARRPHSNCCLAWPGTATGRTRLLPPTAWPPPYQADDDRHSDSREIEKADCLSPYEGPPQAEPRVGRVIASRGPASHNVSVPGTPCSRTHMEGV